MLFVGCLKSLQYASVSQGRICSDSCTCYHTEITVADQICYLTQSQCTDTVPTSPSAGQITQGAWQGSHWITIFLVTGLARPRKRSTPKAGIQPRGRYHGGRRPSSYDSLHSPTVIPPSALDKPSIMKRYHRRRTCSHTSPRRSPTMVTLHDTRFVECPWWSDGWTVKTVVT